MNHSRKRTLDSFLIGFLVKLLFIENIRLIISRVYRETFWLLYAATQLLMRIAAALV